MIALIDYGSGNLRSVHKALLKVGAEVRLVRCAPEIEGTTGVVLPGVGAFDDCILALKRQGLLEVLQALIAGHGCFLGICVGYQALFERSEEFHSAASGLGVFPGTVVRFDPGSRLKVPQIGWNQIRILRPDCPLFLGVEDGSYLYFVHSYFPQPADRGIVAAETDYGQTFASAVWRGNVFATQFHPEKSQKIGLRILENFVAAARRGAAYSQQQTATRPLSGS